MRFRVSFESGNGHWMVLTGMPEWRRQHLIAHEWNMMKGQDVPGLLRLELEETDGRLRLRYALSGYRMLAHALRAVRWTMRDALTGLFRLAGILADGRLYMLEPVRFVLRDDMIFVGKDLSDLALAYLPVADPDAERDEARFVPDLENLVVRWLVQAEDLDGTLFRNLMLLLREPDFTPERMRDAIRSWLYAARTVPVVAAPDDAFEAGEPDVPAARQSGGRKRKLPEISSGVENEPLSPDPACRGAKPDAGDRPEEDFGGSSVLSPEPRQPVHGFPPADGGRTMQPAEPEREEETLLTGLLSEAEPDAAETTRKRRVIAACGAVLMCALAWRFLPDVRPGAPGLMLAGGITLLLAAALICVWTGRFANPVGGRRHRSGLGTAPGFSLQEDLHSASPSRHPPEFRHGEDMATGDSPDVAPAAYTDVLHTTCLGDEGEEQTALLGAEGQTDAYAAAFMETSETSVKDYAAHAERAPRVAVLEWSGGAGEQAETIALRQSPFVIGRSAEAAHHVDRSAGVSRLHVEMTVTPDGWIARDLGSRNGTLLNGRPMTPYAPYLLRDGDTLQIAASVYRFKTEAAASGRSGARNEGRHEEMRRHQTT